MATPTDHQLEPSFGSSWLRQATQRRVWQELRSWGDLWLLVRTVALALRVPLLMRRPLPQLLPYLTPTPVQRPQPEQARKAVVFVRAYLGVFRRLMRRPCLVQGLPLYQLLREAGYGVQVHFGIAPDGKVGHCWLTLDDQPLLEPGNPRERYLEMLQYPAADTAAADEGHETGVTDRPQTQQREDHARI